jgi:hypothetical protein
MVSGGTSRCSNERWAPQQLAEQQTRNTLFVSVTSLFDFNSCYGCILDTHGG